MTTDAQDPGDTLDPRLARGLLEQARAARAHAYAPYSEFPVGAALLSRDRRVFTGVNVEIASYGLSTCAERTAMVGAIAAGVRGFAAVAVVGPENGRPCPPCGACRQILYEADPEMLVVTEDSSGLVITPLRELLPAAFEGADVRRRSVQ